MRTVARLRSIVGTAVVVAVFSFAPATAFGLQSWYGNNYSYDWGGAYGVGVCDGESDGNPAYVRFETNGSSYRLDDGNGSQPGCADQALGTRLYRHHVCEGQFFSDPCGPWRYP